MICSECNEKMVLKRLGAISLSACYECPKCGFRDAYSLREIVEPSYELFELLENMPLGQPDEEQLKWLEELDNILDKYNVQSSNTKVTK